MRKPKPTKKVLKREARKRSPTATSPIKPGTIEVVRETELGPRYAVIRTNAEAAKTVTASPPLLQMIGQITRDLPALPKETHLIQADRLVESLFRNQEIQRRMMSQAFVAAEARWPGFVEMQNLLVEREAEFTKALGEVGVGVA